MQAETGLMSITGTEQGEMVKIGPSVADITTGLYGAIGLLGALYERERSGQGQYLDVAMFDAQFGLLNNWILATVDSGSAPKPMGVGNPALSPYQTVLTGDGTYMLGVGNDLHWRRFCEALSLTKLREDDRFLTNGQRVRNRAALIPLTLATQLALYPRYLHVLPGAKSQPLALDPQPAVIEDAEEQLAPGGTPHGL
jgi:crotonobetainyl-CoA:carnitine CoA-transferase CaiB-like acyl-CoA transferase